MKSHKTNKILILSCAGTSQDACARNLKFWFETKNVNLCERENFPVCKNFSHQHQAPTTRMPSSALRKIVIVSRKFSSTIFAKRIFQWGKRKLWKCWKTNEMKMWNRFPQNPRFSLINVIHIAVVVVGCRCLCTCWLENSPRPCFYVLWLRTHMMMMMCCVMLMLLPLFGMCKGCKIVLLFTCLPL